MKFTVDYTDPRYINLCDQARMTASLAHILAERIDSEHVTEETDDLICMLEELTARVHVLAATLSEDSSTEE